MTAGASAWERFWFARGSAASLGLFRILFAGCLWVEVRTTFARSGFALEGGFHLPYLDWMPLVSPERYALLHEWQYPFIVLLGVGLMSRVACPVLLFLQGWIFFADRLNFRNHPYFFLLLLLLLCFSPCDEAFSLKSWLRRRFAGRDGRDLEHPLTAQRLIQFQVSLVYLYSALAKLNASYFSGDVLQHHVGTWVRSLGLTIDPWFWRVSAGPTIALEAFLGLALWWRRSRPWALALGIPFHLLIGIGMDIKVFSAAVIASYLLFLEPATVPRARDRARKFLQRLASEPPPQEPARYSPIPSAEFQSGRRPRAFSSLSNRASSRVDAI